MQASVQVCTLKTRSSPRSSETANAGPVLRAEIVNGGVEKDVVGVRHSQVKSIHR
jgi:hypothetical protein